ncbi:toxin-antitoxin system YwqK family antitoxin [Aliidiomarina soli]|uniref:DUF1481 domain-containing protein n=1 Tax=Aliidiomarina soli TaxID=1928574 RepID=A0A432WIW2_9GAMM|nr:hypothetical protein [Aliidiomarina soli]RUO33766.1 hypothetical protein CWE14_04690 [Aliidiomarina soli]
MRNLIVFFFICLIVSACSQETSDDNELQKRNGVEHGTRYSWYLNGQLKQETEFSHGQIVRHRAWDRNGKQTSQINVVGQSLDGRVFWTDFVSDAVHSYMEYNFHDGVIQDQRFKVVSENDKGEVSLTDLNVEYSDGLPTKMIFLTREDNQSARSETTYDYLPTHVAIRREGPDYSEQSTSTREALLRQDRLIIKDNLIYQHTSVVDLLTLSMRFYYDYVNSIWWHGLDGNAWEISMQEDGTAQFNSCIVGGRTMDSRGARGTCDTEYGAADELVELDQVQHILADCAALSRPLCRYP